MTLDEQAGHDGPGRGADSPAARTVETTGTEDLVVLIYYEINIGPDKAGHYRCLSRPRRPAPDCGRSCPAFSRTPDD